jgi:hypothetical protein
MDFSKVVAIVASHVQKGGVSGDRETNTLFVVRLSDH